MFKDTQLFFLNIVNQSSPLFVYFLKYFTGQRDAEIIILSSILSTILPQYFVFIENERGEDIRSIMKDETYQSTFS